jgi:hypothetical protein
MYIDFLSSSELFHFWASFVLLPFAKVQLRQMRKHANLQS